MKKFLIGMCLLFMMLGGSALFAQNQSPCPMGLPGNPTCYSGVDENGAYYLIAMPQFYLGRLALWNHGYDGGAPGPLVRPTDLGYGALLLVHGFAVAASSYRPDAIGRGGWAVADGAEDTESLRQRFIDMFGAPGLTFVIGASLGGLVTATITEKYGVADDGSLNYDGALPLCGPLAGGRRNWYGAFDLRVVYQYYCQNLPRSSEPPYPLYLGLAPGSMMSQDEVVMRVNECTGVALPPDRRTPEQRQRLANILGVARIPESFLLTDMVFATLGLQELVQVRTGGRSPVTNLGVMYTGSTDDDALNHGVFRAGSDPAARAWLSAAYDPTGEMYVPSLTMHTIGDGLVIVENEDAYRETLEKAGAVDYLFQTYTNAPGHCQFTQSEFMGIYNGLLSWVQTGNKPTLDQIIGVCEQFRTVFRDTCNFNRTFQPNSFDSRVVPRKP